VRKLLAAIFISSLILSQIQTTAAAISAQSTPGLYDPQTSKFYLRSSNSSGVADAILTYNPSGLIPISGDWTGKGIKTIGLYNSATSTFYLRNSNTSGNADITFTYGPAGQGWIPISGDWTGKGFTSIGLYNPATATFFLKNSNTSGNADITFTYGPAGQGWIPISGDWTGKGITTIGLYNPAAATFFLKNSNAGGNADITFTYGPAGQGWIPISGDWTGKGITTIGLYNPATTTFFLKNSNAGGNADITFTYGWAGNLKPITGNWGNLDAVPPTGSIRINGGSATINTLNATLTISATDLESGMGSGAQMQFSNDNATWSTPETYAATKQWTLSSGDGTKTVYAKFKDAAGNWSSVYSSAILLDTTMPAGSIKINRGSATTNTVNTTLTLFARDTGSGMGQGAQMRFSNDNATWSTAEAYSTTKTWTLSTGAGQKTVYVKFKDAAGNWSKNYSASIVLVTAAPVITTQPAGITLNPGQKASFSVVATGTAPLTYQWKKGSSSIPGATSATYTISSVVSTDAGSYTVTVANSAGSVTSSAAALTITPPDNPWIITPTLVSSVNGLSSNNMFGYSVMPAKNINGGGLNDIIISAPGGSTGTDVGRVYIYFGGDITKNPDLTLTGSTAGGCFGYSIAVGDINGDGCDDIVVSEPYNSEAGTKAGKVYVYFGGPSITNCPNATMKGQAAGDMFGCSITCCDMNNDNRDDIIVGAPYNSAGIGRAYIYFGSQNINTTADVIMAGAASNDLFGYSIASAKNIDGNNNNGIVVGAPGLPTNTDRPGKAYLYLGGNSVNNTADLVMTGQTNGDLFGCSVSAGDFNGDGCDDVIAGAEKNSSIASAAGKAYIYYGGKNMTNAAIVTMTGEAANDRFGRLVSSAGDLNGDGYSDIIAVSPNNASAAGKAYLYFGGLLMDNTVEATIKGEVAGDGLASAVASAGDLNNDGIDELIIGVANNSLNGTNSGKAYLYKIVCSGQPARTADVLMDETEAKACKYFYDQALMTTGAVGLVKDTCYTNYSSTAATGFGLTALCIMANRSGSSAYWTVTSAQAQARVSAILDTLINIQNSQTGNEDDYGKEGFFFHFIGPDGKRETSMNAEVSTVDTALLLAGVLTAGKYFGGDIQTKANTIFNAVNWDYFLDTSDEQYYHGWSPDYGLIQQTWDRPSDETLLISLLAIASDPTNQDFLKAYYGFPRGRNSYASANQTFYVYNSYSGSLFTYIFAHCWYDFKKAGADIPDNVQGARFAVPVNWWENSKTAAQANRQFCIDNIANFSSYSANDWGLSACFRPDRSYFGMNGAPPREYIAPDGGEPANDGTVPPYGAISTLPFMKDLETGGLSTNLAYQALAHYYNDYYFRLWGPYGPRDSFNQLKKFSTMYTGINLGPIALMIENYRSGLLWNTFMADSRIAQANHSLYTDTMAPVITQFSVSNPDSPTAGYTNSAVVNVVIDGFDALGITKWLITETSARPAAASFTLTLKPASYTIISTGSGLKRLYAWGMDAANNISALNSNSQAQIYLDTTAPSVGTVSMDGPYTASSTQLHAKWSGDDAESGVIEYQYRITDGSSTGTVIRDWTSAGTVPEVTATGLTLTQNHTYYFGIKAKNGAGSWSVTQYSTGITYNPLVPDVTAIKPNDGAFVYTDTARVVRPTYNNPDGYTLQFQFTVKNVIKQAWTTTDTYMWTPAQSDIGSGNVKIEVKNQYGTNYRASAVFVVQKPIGAPAEPIYPQPLIKR